METTEKIKLLNFNKVLCLSPHPDDIEYSMSGTIAKHPDTHFYVVTLTAGTPSDPTTGKHRIDETEKFWKQFPVPNVTLKPILYASVFNTSNIIKILEDFIITENIDAIAGPSAEDSHFEHREINSLMSPLSRNKPLSLIEYKCSSTLYSWEPNFFVDVSDILSSKITALRSSFVSQLDGLYFKDNALRAFHQDFISIKKQYPANEQFKIKSLYTKTK